MIDAYILEHFAAFCQCGTISAASQKLNVSQPAVTRSMKLLEQKLDAKIFDRTQNKLTLTEAGKIAAEYTQKIIDLETEMLIKVKNKQLSLSTIQFGCISYSICSFIKDFVSRQFPHLKVKEDFIDSEEQTLNKIEKDEYKFSILSENFVNTIKNRDKYFIDYFDTEELFAYIHKDNPLYNRNNLNIQDLNDQTLLVISNVKFWNNILTATLNNVRQIKQQNFFDFKELADNSTITTFISSFDKHCIPDYRLSTSNRKIIPIQDNPLKQNFYFICKQQNILNIKPTLDIIKKELQS